jgi:hypothetical protein
VAKPSSTVIVLVGVVAPAVFAELDRSANVHASVIDSDAGETAREFVARSHTTYVVHNADPLASLGEAWAGFFDETVPTGTLEVAVEATLRTLRSDEAALPDYYIVLDPDSLTPTQKNWWFGALAGVAPSRVVPSGATADEVGRAISNLPAGRWWPEPLDEWVRSLARVIPDAHTLIRP